MQNDLIEVKVYRMLGLNPAPVTDQLLGTVDVRPDVDNTWAIAQVQIPPGNHTIYVFAEDRISNVSRKSKPIQFETQS